MQKLIYLEGAGGDGTCKGRGYAESEARGEQI